MEPQNNKDKIFYKQRPYIYVGLAILGMYFAEKSKIAMMFGILLMVCGLIVLFMRQTYKEHQEKLKLQRKEQDKKDFAIRIKTKDQ